MRFTLVYLLFAVVTSQTCVAGVSPRDVDAAILSAKKFLYGKQQADGTWERLPDSHGDQKTGHTALVVHALLSAGESHQDPRLVKAIEYIRNTPTTGVYALGVRCQLWNELPPSAEIKTVMQKDAKALMSGIQREAKVPGFYPYNSDGVNTAYSLSRAHYAVLGVWAAAQSGVEVPNSYWQLVERSWIAQQDPSGGWSYKGKDFKPGKNSQDKGEYPVTPGMTADGIATLFITQDYLHADEAISPRGNIKNAHIDKAMAWMAANFDKVSKDEKFSRDYPMATLYAIERIGAASGFKYFKDIDWYDQGAGRLLRNQKRDGSWKGDLSGYEIAGTSFAMLFLSRGRAPVVMNKLDYEINDGTKVVQGNWNQRPRDIANVTRWIGKQSERELNWQIVNLNATVSDLHDAPILFISGNQELKFSEEKTRKLRQFVEGGGMILANADATAAAFIKSFRQLGKQLFPAYEFRQLPADHAIFTSPYSAQSWKRKPTVLALGNGAREFMLMVPDMDLSRAWQIQETSSRTELFQLAANVYFYSVEKQEAQNKGESFQVVADERIKPTRAIEVARLKFAGNWDPEPGGWRRMTAILNNRDRVGVKLSEVEATKGPLVGGVAKVAHLTGVGKVRLAEPARAAIKKFVVEGGTLLVDAAGGNAEFAQSAEAELNAIFVEDAAQLKDPLPSDDPIYSVEGKKLDDIGYRAFARQKLVGELKGPRLRGIRIDGRLAVIYSPEDLSVGIVGQPVDGIVGYKPSTATALVRAILLNAIKPASPAQASSKPTTSQPATSRSTK